MINKAKHITVSFVDHVYINKSLIEDFSTTVPVENIYFSDHHTAQIEKIAVIFVLLKKIQYDKAIKKNLLIFS